MAESSETFHPDPGSWPGKPERSRVEVEVSSEAVCLRIPPRGWRAPEVWLLLVAGGGFFGGLSLMLLAFSLLQFRGVIDLLGVAVSFAGLAMAAFAVHVAWRAAVWSSELEMSPAEVSVWERTTRGEKRQSWPRESVVWVDLVRLGGAGQNSLKTVLRLRFADGSECKAMAEASRADREWMVGVMQRVLGLRDAARVVEPVNLRGPERELPPEIRVRRLVDGVRFDFPHADLGDDRPRIMSQLRLGLILLVVLPVGVVGAFFLGQSMALPQAPLVAGLMLVGVIAPVKMTAGLFLVIRAMRILLLGPTIEITRGEIRAIDRGGFAAASQSRSLMALERLSVIVQQRLKDPKRPSPSVNEQDRETALVAFSQGLPPLVLADGYPRDWMTRLVTTLAREVQAARRIAAATHPAIPDLVADLRPDDIEANEHIDDQPAVAVLGLTRTATGFVLEASGRSRHRHKSASLKSTAALLLFWAMLNLGLFWWIPPGNRPALGVMVGCIMALFGCSLALDFLLPFIGPVPDFNRVEVNQESVVVAWNFKREERIARKEIVAVDLGQSTAPAEDGKSPPGVLRLLCHDGRNVTLSSNRRWAEQRWVRTLLMRELGLISTEGGGQAVRGEANVGYTPPPRPADLPPLPDGNRITASSTNEGLRLQLKAGRDHWRVAGFVMLFLGMILLSGLSKSSGQQNGSLTTGDIVVIAATLAMVVPGLALVAVGMGQPSASLLLNSDLLMIEERSDGKQTQQHFERQEIDTIDLERAAHAEWMIGKPFGSRWPMARRRPLVLSIRTRQGRCEKSLKGWSDVDVEWVAGVIRRWAEPIEMHRTSGGSPVANQ